MASNAVLTLRDTGSGIHSSRLHAVMYGMLLIATPFVLLQNFLVELISHISMSTVNILGQDVPVLPVAAGIGLAAVLFACRRRLTRTHLLAGAIALLMIAAAQQVTDYYFNHNFYDLQQNWHYFAYGGFVYLVHRDLAPRGVPLAKQMLTTYSLTLGLSVFDEAFQMQMSSRVFDLSDTGKDIWGTLIGLIVLYMFVTSPERMREQWRRVRHRRLAAYLKHPPSLIVSMALFGWLLLSFASLLSEIEYWYVVVLCTLAGFVAVFSLWHLSQFKLGKYGLIAALSVALIVQGWFFVKHRNDGIIHNEYGLTVYNGIPVPFFDVMIYPNGMMRLVDKKHYFNRRDQQFFMQQGADILLIGSGSEGLGGDGFPKKEPVQFLYNAHTQRGMQVIIQKTREACATYNRLKREGKNVLFVIHNTC